MESLQRSSKKPYRLLLSIIHQKYFYSTLLIIAISIFFIIQVQNGHDWGGDFSMYIMNAQNLINGNSYGQTSYIYNPDVPFYGPIAYPPIFPLLLAPFIAFWGINLQILKLPGIFCFIGLLYFMDRKVVNNDTPVWYRILFLSIVGFFPYFFILSDSILSDIPFFFICTIALERINTSLNPNKKVNAIQLVLTGLLIYLAYGTRSIGLLLVPLALILSFIRYRKITASFLIIFSVSTTLIILQNYLIPGTAAYTDQIPSSLQLMFSVCLSSIVYYFKFFSSFFTFKSFIIQDVVFLIILEGFAFGLITRLKKGVTSFELFFLLYLCTLLLWPSYQGLRLLVPIIPLYFLFFTEGIQQLLDKLTRNRKIKSLIPISLIILVVSYYSFSYSQILPRDKSAMEQPQTLQLFQFIQTNTKTDDVIAFFKPRVLALYTNRKACALAILPDTEYVFNRMKELGIDFVILRKDYSLEYQPELSALVEKYPRKFETYFENSEFKIFKYIQ